jgi:hypothetical protein
LVNDLKNAGLSCQAVVEPPKPARKCKIPRNTLNILGENADYYEEDSKIVFFCDVTEDNAHQQGSKSEVKTPRLGRLRLGQISTAEARLG